MSGGVLWGASLVHAPPHKEAALSAWLHHTRWSVLVGAGHGEAEDREVHEFFGIGYIKRVSNTVP